MNQIEINFAGCHGIFVGEKCLAVFRDLAQANEYQQSKCAGLDTQILQFGEKHDKPQLKRAEAMKGFEVGR